MRRLSVWAGIVGLLVAATAVWQANSQNSDPDILGSWSGYVPCRGGESANASLLVTPRGFSDGGWSGALSFNGISGRFEGKSYDGAYFQPESSALNTGGTTSFRVKPVSAYELEVTTTNGSCVTRSILQRNRDDKPNPVLLFRPGQAHEWAGKPPSTRVGDADFFDYLEGSTGNDPAFICTLARVRETCTFGSVEVRAFSQPMQGFALTLARPRAAAGIFGKCQDGTQVSLAVPSNISFDRDSPSAFGAAMACESRADEQTFKACGTVSGSFACVTGQKPSSGFSCGVNAPRVIVETTDALLRASPESCTVDTFQVCDLGAGGSVSNCRTQVGARTCTGGQNTPRPGEITPFAISFRTFGGTDTFSAVVDVPGPVGASRPGVCPSRFDARRGRGEGLRCYCPATSAVMNFWGGEDGVYADTSNICGAAIHSGVIQQEGMIVVTPAPVPAAFTSSVRNGVKSLARDSAEGAFRILAPDDPSVADLIKPSGPAPIPMAGSATLTASMVGPWAGSLQSGGDTPSARPLSVRIDSAAGKLSASITYSQPDCRATWTMTAANAEAVDFVEAIETGRDRCTAFSRVRASRGTGATIKIEATSADGGNTYTGTLGRPQQQQSGPRCADTYDDLPPVSGPYTCSCAGRVDTTDTVWGDASGFYSRYSAICAAAVHAGAIDDNSGGRITLSPAPERSGWTGLRRNGVLARDADGDEAEDGFTVTRAQ